MATFEAKFRAYIKAAGLKFTPKRRLILKEIFALHNHFDVDELYENLRKKVSRATIYRMLPILIKSGLIREILSPEAHGRASYEHIFGHDHHDHLLCIRCGKVVEFSEPKIEELQDLVCKRYGFEPLEHRLGIRGYCRDCSKKSVVGKSKRGKHQKLGKSEAKI